MADKIKRLYKGIIFIILIGVLLWKMDRLFVIKAPEILMMDEFNSLDRNTVDLLCVGSSHAYTSFNTEVFWNDYGIPSFCISGPSQPVGLSYYFMKHALKSQKPKVIMLEASCMLSAHSDYDYGSMVSLASLPYSTVRQKALEEAVVSSSRENMEWNILCFHNRWKELTKEDYQYMFKNTRPETKGFNPWWNYNDYNDSIAVYNINDKEKPCPESIEYVDKINDLCEKNGIKLVVYLAAHMIDEGTYRQMNWYRECLGEKGIDFIDGIQLSDQLGLDAEIDNCNGHMSYWGSLKLSKYIGQYLTEKDYIVDRHGDQRYDAWEENAHYYEKTADMYSLVNSKDVSQYLESVLEMDEAVVILEYNGAAQQDIEISSDLLNVLERKDIGINFAGLPYVQVRFRDRAVYEMQSETISQRVRMDGAPAVRINKEPGRGMSIFIEYGRISPIQQDNSIPLLRVYVYNNVSGEMADVRAVDVVEGRFCDN